MTPTLPEVMLGQAAALSAPQPPEAGADYVAGRIGMVVLLAMLAAQEAERGPAALAWENAAIRALLAAAAGDYDLALPDPAGEDQSLTALNAVNAALRRTLIALHEAAEARGDGALDGEIIGLYRAMAHARRLDLPAALAG